MDATTTRRRRARRTRSRACRDLWKSAANPERAYTAVAAESRGIHPVRQPRRPPRRRSRRARTCHAAEVRNVAHEHDDARRDAVGGGALQQRRACRSRTRATAKATRPTARRSGCRPSRRRRRRRRGPRASCPSSIRCRAGRSRSRATCCACSSAAASRRRRSATRRRREEPGRPDVKLSDRGFGTLLRTDPVFLGLQKTRLLDPLLSFPGTNDQPGDYRGSGCTGCHVVYANDRVPGALGAVRAVRQRRGAPQTVDPTIDPEARRSRAIRSSTRSRGRSRRASA